MRGMARVGDKCRGTCTSHRNAITVEGVIISGSSDASSGGRAIARVGDKVRADCGHEGIIITGAPDTFVNGRPHARLGDQFKGEYTGIIISASTDSY